MKPAVLISAIAGFVNLAAAAPPACLLAALGQQPSPAGVENLCDDHMAAMVGNLTSVCNGNDLKPAYDAYASTCAEIGFKVDDLPLTSATVNAPTSTPEPSGSSEPDATPTPSIPTSTGDNPQESKPSAAGAIAPHAFLFTVLGLSATSLVSMVFL
ncbi:Covalently-linked cell wall protein 14 [Colletotrichum shisoi]|uniref:Covalently-linked cell wall protein 14 n=1 Tax=Colletotrichum shisoi TaxID=2078593 RepID=A0A5Q4BWC5_9PEZI|nr:Covalently-linked cell wall protein 14 [Colletotrichum shisoi]